jgi:integrase
MGRPPLEIGQHGSINVTGSKGRFRARCLFRDLDGVTREAERTGPSKQAARSNLLTALKERRRTSVEGDIGPDTLIKDLAKLWTARMLKKVDAGKRSPGTQEKYQIYLDGVIVKQLGELKVREVTVSRADAVIQGVVTDRGPGAAQLTRAVLSGLLGLAALHDAVETVATRHADTIDTPDKAPARALTLDEVAVIRGKCRYDKPSVARDLPDFLDMLFATGVRIGEVCAITWDCLDLDEGTATILGVVVRVKGKGLIIKTYPGSKTKHRVLKLPRWAVDMLTIRKVTHPTNEWNAVFTSPKGLLRDPSNTQADLRELFRKEFKSDSGEVLFPAMPDVTSHLFGRKTVLTLMNKASLPASAAADQAGHAKISMTQDHYFGRKTLDTGAARVLEDAMDTMRGAG